MEYGGAVFQVVIIRGKLGQEGIQQYVPDYDPTSFMAQQSIAVEPVSGRIEGDKPLTVYYGSGLPVHGKSVQMEDRREALVVPDASQDFFSGDPVEKYGLRVVRTRKH